MELKLLYIISKKVMEEPFNGGRTTQAITIQATHTYRIPTQAITTQATTTQATEFKIVNFIIQATY